MAPNCQTVEQHQVEMLLRELPSIQHNQLQQHLRDCTACRERIRETQQLLRAMAAFKPLPASADRRQEVLRRIGPQTTAMSYRNEIEARSESSRMKRPSQRPVMLLGLLLAGGLFVGVADIGGFRSSLLGVSPVVDTRLRPVSPDRKPSQPEGVVQKRPRPGPATAGSSFENDLDRLAARLRSRPVAAQLGPIALGPAGRRLLEAARSRLVAALDDDQRRLAATAVLSRMPAGTGAQRLRQLVSQLDGALDVRLLALRALVAWNDREAARLSRALMLGQATPGKLVTLAGLVQIKLQRDPAGLSALLFALDDVEAADGLARAIGVGGSAQVIAYFDMKLRSETQVERRLLAAQVLLANNKPVARTSIDGMLNSGESALFRYQLLGLVLDRHEYWLPTLQSLALNDSSAHIRGLALKGLGNAADRLPAKREELRAFMLERLRAARSADEIYWPAQHLADMPDIQRELGNLLKGTSSQQIAMLRSLNRLKTDFYWADVSRLAGTGAGDVRLEAILALGRAGRANKRLVELYRDSDPRVSTMAALGLHLQGTKTTNIKAAVALALARNVAVRELKSWTVDGMKAYLRRTWRIKLELVGEQAQARLTERLPAPRGISEPIESILSRFAEQHGLRYEQTDGRVKIH